MSMHRCNCNACCYDTASPSALRHLQTLAPAHRHFPHDDAPHSDRCYVGICPACGERVLWDDPDGPVWTCPRDLSDGNPWKDHEEPYSEAELEAAGVYSQCGEYHGNGCLESMPLHSACYEKGEY